MSQGPAIAANQIATLYEPTPMQQGMLLRHLEAPENTSYVMQSRYACQGPLCVKALTEALCDLAQRHALLRAGFVSQGLVTPKVVIYRSAKPTVRVCSGAHTPEQVQEICRADRAQGFDLRFAPLMRWTVIQTGEAAHVICKTYHHLITDGFSSARLMRELLTRYAFRVGVVKDSNLAVAPRPFSDYAKWLRGQPLDGARVYWKKRLAELRGGSADRLGVTDSPIESTLLELDVEQSAAIHAWTQAHNCTFAVLMQGVFGLMFRKERPDLAPLIGLVHRVCPGDWEPEEISFGPMIGTVPLVIPTPESNQSWPNYLRMLLASSFEDRQHAHLSLADISAQAPGALQGTRLFQLLLVVEHAHSEPTTTSRQAGYDALPTISPLGIQDGSEYPMTVYAVPGKRICLRLHAATEVFGKGAANRWARAFRELLTSLLDAPASVRATFAPPRWPRGANEKGVPDQGAGLALNAQLGSKKRDPSPAGWAAPDPWHALLAWSDRSPDQEAVRMGEQVWTFAELVHQAKVCAAALAERGVGVQDLVGLSGARGPWLLAAIFGVWARGAAFLPVSCFGPALARQALLAQTTPKVLLCGPDCPAFELPNPGPVSVPYEQWSQGSQTQMPCALHPEQLAYVLGTSGSTGRPKGVAVSRHALASFLSAMRSVVRMDAGQSWLSVTRLGFDISLLELLYPLMHGARCVLLDEQSAQDGHLLAQKLNEGGFDVFQATPSSWELICAAGLDAPGLHALCGGEPLSKNLAERIAAGVASLTNVYGPTEATIWASFAWVSQEDARVSIGRPMPGVGLRVAARSPWELGEIRISGPTLARGYFRSPRLTAQSFIPDPSGVGTREYRSGDLGYQDLSGRFFCRGRSDRQVKVRGHRIELRAVESAMQDSDLGIEQAAVLVLPDEAHCAPVLGAAFVAQEVVDLQILRARMARRLPVAALPVRWRQVDAFPRTASQKRDDAAIARLLDDAAEVSSRRPTRDDDVIEQLATQLWIELLGAGGREDDDFFAQGGHSLIAMRMSARLSPMLGAQIPVAWLLSNPRRLDWLDKLRLAHRGAATGLVQRVDRETPFVATPAQRRFWWLETREARAGRYNLSVALHLSQAIDQEQLASAVNRLVELHPLLKTRFVRMGTQLGVETVGEAASDPAEAWGLLSRKATGSWAQLVERARMDRFELEKRPAWWIGVVPDGAGSKLLLCGHHALLDARSLELLLGGLAEIMSGSDQRQTVPLDFGSYAEWSQTLEASGRLDRDAQFFRSRLPAQAGARDFAFFQANALASCEELRPSLRLDPGLCTRWVKLNQRTMTTHFMVLLAAMGRWLVPLTGRTQVCVGAPHHARSDDARLDTVVGPFVTTLPWTLDLRDAPDATRLLKRVRNLVLEGARYGLAPLERCYDPGQGEPWAAMLSMQTAGAKTHIEGASFVDRPRSGHKSSLTLYAKLNSCGAVDLELSYDPRRFRAPDAQELLHRFESSLRGVIDGLPHASQAPGTCSGPDTPTQQGSELWTPRAHEDAPKSLMHRFCHWVRQRPDAIALQTRDEFRSYAQLWEQAQRLASALHDKGVQSGDVVALELSRGVNCVVGMLGVLACGAAYLPLEPCWPSARKSALRDRAKAVGCLTDASRPSDLAWHLGTLLQAQTQIIDLSHRWSEKLVAYLLFTSGSTGTPKGVAVTHENVDALLAASEERFSFSSEDCWSCTHSYGFDFSVWEIWGALRSGARLYLLDHEQRRDPQALLTLLQEAGISVLSQTPSAFASLLATAGRKEDFRWSESLRYVVFGGEALSTQLLAPWWSRQGAGVAKLINMYGITESTVHVTYAPVPEPQTPRAQARCGSQDAASLGRPLPGVGVELLAPDLSLVAQGAQGEIFVRGSGVSLGYWHEPRMTAQRFLPDPQGCGQRRYQSGDLAKLGADGTLVFCGRKDAQIQLRGYRVEPGELAARLRAHPLVEQAQVLVRREDERAVGLVAFYQGAKQLSPKSLLASVQAVLPEHLWPSTCVPVAQMPRTINDKIDVGALWKLYARAVRQDSQAASNELERLVTQVFSRLLKTRIGPRDDFFRCGGHSLLAVDLAHALSQAIGQSVPVGWVLEHPSPLGLAKRCRMEHGKQQPRLIELGAGSGKHDDHWLVCVHPGGGHVQGYQALAQSLSNHAVRVWGLASPGVDDASYQATSIAQMASRYIERLANLAKKARVSRIHLLGWSSGAITAAAMAHRWPARGLELSGLSLLDPPRPGHAKSLAFMPAANWAGFLDALGLGPQDARVAELCGPEREALAEQWAQAHAQGQAWTWLAKTLRARALFEPALSAEFLRWRYARVVHAARLVGQHRPESVTCPVQIWRAYPHDASPQSAEPASAWVLAPRVQLHGYLGNHRDIVSDPAIAASIAALFGQRNAPARQTSH